MQERNVRTTPDLFTPVEVGALTLRNRIVMAPLTRSRAGPGNVPHQLCAARERRADHLGGDANRA